MAAQHQAAAIFAHHRQMELLEEATKGLENFVASTGRAAYIEALGVPRPAVTQNDLFERGD